MASAVIQILTGEQAGQSFLVEGKAVVGRDAGLDIQISDRSISRKHAQFEQRGDGFHLTDLGSHNGTRLNGLPITEVMLPTACRIQFGTVEADYTEVSVNLPAHIPRGADSDGEDWQSLPHDVSGNLDDIFHVPDGLDEIDEREAARKKEAHKKMLDLSYGVGMILVLILGVYIFSRVGAETRIPREAIFMHRTNERLIPFRYERYMNYVVEHESIVDIEPDTEYWWMLNVRALEPGETKVRFYGRKGQVLVLTVVVLGDPPPVDDREYHNLPDHERINMAQQLVAQGNHLVKEMPWHALQSYRQAVRVARPIEPIPSIAVEAEHRANIVNEKINDEVASLMMQARGSRKTLAPIFLNRVKQLIPDETDKRHQRAHNIILVMYPEFFRQVRTR